MKVRADSALKVAAWYLVLAGLYIVISGVLVFRAADTGAEWYLGYEIAKGLGFVAVTSVMLFWLVRRQLEKLERKARRQVEIEQALRRSRDQLTAAQEIAGLGSWEADLVSGRLVWSEGVYRLFGLEPDQFGHTIDDFFSFVHADDRAALQRAQRRALAGEAPLAAEHRIVRPDGEVRHVVERAQVRFDDDGKPVAQLGTVQDITERKLVELELEKRGRQQAAVAELGMRALGTRDLTRLMDRAMEMAARILDVEYAGVLELDDSGEIIRLVTGVGWPRDILGRTTIRTGRHSQAGFTLMVNEPVVVEDMRTETRFSAAPGMLERGLVSSVSTVIQGESSPWGVVGVHTTRRRTFADADVAFVQAIANIIGEALQREKALRVIQERNSLTQLAGEAAALGGWAYDPATDTVTWSDRVARIHEVEPGYFPTVAEGIEFFAPEHRDRMSHCFEACLAEGVPYDEELQLITARGRRVWVRVIGQAERDDAGNVVRLHGAIQDISERKALESMLHQSQRLEAVGQLTGGIAHDFNNLLTVILGNADRLIRMAGEDREVRTLAETAYQAARRGADLTGRLLAYARKQPLDPAPTDIAELLSGMDELLRRTLGAQVEIEVVRGGGLWTAMVDAAQLESAVLNLCLNARDAMPDGGRLTLETANVHLDDDYARRAREITPGHYVMIAVTDTGHGVAAELAERVFEPFFTTKPSGQGSGLGLSMVYGFVKQSHGHIRLYSEPGQGTTVKLYLPRTREKVEPTEPDRGQRVNRGRGELVLVVEDDDLVRSFVADQVTSLGYRVLTAANGAEALRLVEGRDDIDLLFTDVVMPGSLDGRQLAEAARALRPDLPVLFTSGYTQNAIVHQGRLDPGIALLNKPYRLADLAKKLEDALNSRSGSDPGGPHRPG